MTLTLGSLDKTLYGIKDVVGGFLQIDTEDPYTDDAEQVWNLPLRICRYNTEQEIDRVEIQIKGNKRITIRTVDAGEKEK